MKYAALSLENPTLLPKKMLDTNDFNKSVKVDEQGLPVVINGSDNY